MFIYFNENKLAYHKGQLAPFFIAFIIILVIATLVTVNIGKIAKTKTYSANAVDAGALAAASIMASTFNYIAVANSYMIVNYEYFIASAIITFAIAYIAMAVAIVNTYSGMAQACLNPCGALASVLLAIGAIEIFNDSMVALAVLTTAYWLTQIFAYQDMREDVDENWQAAIDAGYSIAFSNSGISSKLTDDQKDEFSDWSENNIENIASNTPLAYTWTDGQNREHSATTQIVIDYPGTYEIKHTVLPYAAILVLLIAAWVLGYVAIGILDIASITLAVGCALQATIVFWIVWVVVCLVTEVPVALIAAALPFEFAAFGPAITAEAGLAPNGNFESSSKNDVWVPIICWLVEVEHNRLVDAYQTQAHEGSDLGMWQTTYPDVSSSSKANFAGTGDIEDPDPSFDSELIAIDF